MKILLTGANGYIGKRLLINLLNDGHEVICCVRDKARLSQKDELNGKISLLEIDFLNISPDLELPTNIDAAYYLIHSMASSIENFDELEEVSARNFTNLMTQCKIKQVIYLGGIVNDKTLSKHLLSRYNVGNIIASGNYQTTILRAGIIIGSGSASFEIIRDLVEKLPVLIAPKWLLTRSQPIAIRNVMAYLKAVLLNEKCMGKVFDIGGADILTYEEMLRIFAEERGLKRIFIGLPFMTPRISSYWLYFVTSTSFKLATNLVDSMKVEVVCSDNSLSEITGIEPISFRNAIKMAYDKIEQNDIISSWKDSLSSGILTSPLSHFVEIPTHGCYRDSRQVILKRSPELVVKNIWAIGGNTGWYYATWLWQLRGYWDKLEGGVGLRRGRTHPTEIYVGDSLDFWRVLLADKVKMRLLLFAEMKIPGEAWLEFRIRRMNNKDILIQTATFRPLGIWGRLYWFLTQPFHFFIFRGMINTIATK